MGVSFPFIYQEAPLMAEDCASFLLYKYQGKVYSVQTVNGAIMAIYEYMDCQSEPGNCA